MKPKVLLVTYFAFALTFPSAHAGVSADQIVAICENNQAHPDSLLKAELNKLIDDYKDQATRVAHRHEFVAALDQFISKTEFASLLTCRDLPGINYKLAFQDPAVGDQSMQVRDMDGATILFFNLTKSVERVLIVYMHEMTHVCQTIERQMQSTNANRVRFQLFGEVQAFYNMQTYFKRFITITPRMCMAEGTNSDQGKLYQAYQEGELKLENGTFVQAIVNGYLPLYEGYTDEIIVPNSREHHYIDPLTGEGYKLKELQPQLKALIKRLPISIIDG